MQTYLYVLVVLLMKRENVPAVGRNISRRMALNNFRQSKYSAHSIFQRPRVHFNCPSCDARNNGYSLTQCLNSLSSVPVNKRNNTLPAAPPTGWFIDPLYLQVVSNINPLGGADTLKFCDVFVSHLYKTCFPEPSRCPNWLLRTM